MILARTRQQRGLSSFFVLLQGKHILPVHATIPAQYMLVDDNKTPIIMTTLTHFLSQNAVCHSYLV